MTTSRKLVLVKLCHSAIWVFFNLVIFYMLYAVITDRVDRWVWVGLALVGLETLVLLLFRSHCPLTLVARRYSASERANFDIYLPEWLARYNKTIYGLIMLVIIVLLILRIT